jgi:DNA-binding MarR family transcriptional regulator
MSHASTPWTPLPQDVSLLPVLRQLEECHTQVSRTMTRFVEGQGLTMPQFDVLVTLGDMAGMTCKQLGEQSLTTKGSLLPILDRLEAKGLVRRAKGEQDSRQTIVSVTDEGQALYQEVFTAYLAAVQPLLAMLTASEQQDLVRLLIKLKKAFAQGLDPMAAPDKG